MRLFPRLHAIAFPAGKLLGLLFLILGCKLCLIGACGSSLPFFDQWPAEGELLLQPWVHHQWHWSDLFLPFHQHRIALTRLMVLGLYQLNGQWDARVEMMASACIHAAVALCLGAILIRALGREREDAVLVCIALLFCLPFGWENTLSGFQSQFYFELLFSVLTIWGLAMHKPWSLPWGVGIVSAVLAWFSVASGPLAPLAVAGWMAVKLYRREGANWSTLAVACVLAIGGACVSLIGVPQSEQLHPRSVMEFLGVFAGFLSWPSLTAPCVFAVFFPFAYLLWRRLRSRQAIEPGAAESFLFPLGLWIILQAGLLAYGRGRYGVGVPRYRDLFSPVALINFSCLLIVLRELPVRTPRIRRRFIVLAVVWTGFVLFGIGSLTILSLEGELPFLTYNNEQQRKVISEFILTGDAHVFVGKRPFDLQCEITHVPAMIGMLRDPAMREILPAAARPPLQLAPAEALNFPVESLAGEEPAWVSHLPEDAPVARFRSAPIEHCAPWLEFQVRGDAGTPETRIGLIAREGTDQEQINWVLPEREPGNGWRTVLVKTPETPFIVEAATRGGKDRAIAFRNPREVGALSALAQGVLADDPAWMVFIGAALWAGICLWEKWRCEDEAAVDLDGIARPSTAPVLAG